MQFIADLVDTMRAEGNTLILVDRIKTGQELESIIVDPVFIQGRTKLEDREEEYDEIATQQHKVIIATYGVAAVGINLPKNI